MAFMLRQLSYEESVAAHLSFIGTAVLMNDTNVGWICTQRSDYKPILLHLMKFLTIYNEPYSMCSVYNTRFTEYACFIIIA